MMRRRSLALGLALAVLAPLAVPAPAGADITPEPVVIDAGTWLVSQQQADGGFEVVGFPGFETPDAVFALASAYQVGPTWDDAFALDGVTSITTGGNHALDAIDDLVDGEADDTSDAAGARAAKLVTLVTGPLGMDATDFDPSDNSAEPVDLVARMNLHRGGDGSYDFGAQFNGVLYAAIALETLGEPVPDELVEQILAAQRPDGSWDYTGTPTADGNDIDTTATALIALRSAGLTAGNPDVAEAVAFLASRQSASGAWQAFGSDDPNSTSLATVALNDLHIDVTTSAWRAAAGTPVSGPYMAPQNWLRSQQADDGRIASPNDAFGVNTFATTQSLQALTRQWFLADERASLLDHWSLTLASPAAAPESGQAVGVGSDALGHNPSARAARTAGATAMVTGQDGREAAAADLFQAAFGRGLDPSGRAYWSSKLVTITRPEMLARLTGSTEFYRTAGGTTESFVDAVYEAALGREADPSGRAFWVSRLDRGASVRAVARSITASSEYRRLQVTTAYERVLDRAASVGERDYWTDRVATVRIEVLLATLASSSELYDREDV